MLWHSAAEFVQMLIFILAIFLTGCPTSKELVQALLYTRQMTSMHVVNAYVGSRRGDCYFQIQSLKGGGHKVEIGAHVQREPTL